MNSILDIFINSVSGIFINSVPGIFINSVSGIFLNSGEMDMTSGGDQNDFGLMAKTSRSVKPQKFVFLFLIFFRWGTTFLDLKVLSSVRSVRFQLTVRSVHV